MQLNLEWCWTKHQTKQVIVLPLYFTFSKHKVHRHVKSKFFQSSWCIKALSTSDDFGTQFRTKSRLMSIGLINPASLDEVTEGGRQGGLRGLRRTWSTEKHKCEQTSTTWYVLIWWKKSALFLFQYFLVSIDSTNEWSWSWWSCCSGMLKWNVKAWNLDFTIGKFDALKYYNVGLIWHQF